MSTRTFGILASLVGSALSAWWMIHHRQVRNTAGLTPPRDHGTVILDTAPTPAEIDAIL